MSNETQTPASQPQSEEENSGQTANGNNGFDNVAAQYRAMQEAQLLHEETINQLREEIRGQREKLAELSKNAPNVKTGQVDMVMLRLTELERKIGEGAPDPLINEIAHRLAALENNGPMRGAKDPRVDEIHKQLDALRQQLEEAGGGDPRTDDVVLRIASLEAAFRRAAQSRDPEEVQARIDALAEELSSRQEAELAELRAGLSEASKAASEAKAAEADAASSQALGELSERLGEVERQLADGGAQQQLSAFGEQLAGLERKLAEHDHRDVDERVKTLEERLADEQSDMGWQEVANRVDSLEAKLKESAQAPAQDQLQQLEAKLAEHDHPAFEEKIKALEERLADEQPNAGLEEVANRVDSLEAKLEESADGPAQDQLRELEAKLAALESSPNIESLERRIQELASQSEDSDVSRRLIELAGRVRALESSAEETSQAADPEALEQLGQRLGKLEEQGPQATLNELSRLEREMRALQAVSRDAEELPAELIARLEELENRVTDAESSSRLEDTHARLAAVESKWVVLGEPADLGRRLTVLEMDGRQAQDPRVDELVQRLSALEAKPADSIRDERLQQLAVTVEKLRAGLQSVSGPQTSLPADLPERLARLESQVLSAAANQTAAEPAQLEAVSELRSQLQALGDRIEELANRPAASGQDPRVSELAARMEWVERKASDLPDPPEVDVDELKQRIEALERGLGAGSGEGLSSGAKAEIAARFAAIEDALAASGQGQAGVDVETLLRKETERWNQWARSTIDEIGEIRGRIDSLSGSGSGLDAESAEALGIQISSGLNTSEVRALRAQMYFVYLSIGMLWAIVLYVLFAG